jgi:RNA polymerase sigma-70 factor (ECF subfamily)
MTGDAKAQVAPSEFRRQLESLIPAMRKYACRLTHDRDAADELLHDCIVRVLEKQHLFELGTDLEAWVITIMRNMYVSGGRATSRRRAALSQCRYDDVAPPKAEIAVIVGETSAALKRMTKARRDAVVLVSVVPPTAL